MNKKEIMKPIEGKLNLEEFIPPVAISIKMNYTLYTKNEIWIYRSIDDKHPFKLEPPSGEIEITLVEPQALYMSGSPVDLKLEIVGWRIG